LQKREATSARQTEEWGMQMLQTSFPQVKVRLVYKERGEQRIYLKMLVLLNNMHARMVSINQIRNTYMKHLTKMQMKMYSFDGDGVWVFQGVLAFFPLNILVSIHLQCLTLI
jgi:hypothetical protein